MPENAVDTRFRALINKGKILANQAAKRTLFQTEKKQRDESKERDERLQSWASHPTCKKDFLPWLDALIEDNEDAMDNAIDGSALLRSQGIKTGMRLVRKRFLEWTGQAEE